MNLDTDIRTALGATGTPRSRGTPRMVRKSRIIQAHSIVAVAGTRKLKLKGIAATEREMPKMCNEQG